MSRSVGVIDVAVGVVRRAEQILIAQRPSQVHCGGLWEFPGGKVEPGEEPLQALQRELHEEIGIHVQQAQPLTNIVHEYPQCCVHLHVFTVTNFQGEPSGCEQQPIRWIAVDALSEYAFPDGNQGILCLLNPSEGSDILR